MAIVVYKCDTCKREIEIQRNIQGLEHVGRCNITHGCRGKLYQVNIFEDFVRGTIPDPVVGLDDWKQRKVLHNHDQAIERDEWLIHHGMGVIPIVSVYGDRPIEGDLDNRVEVTPSEVIAVDQDTIRVLFDRPWSGVAQLVARQSDPDLFRDDVSLASAEEEAAVQISINGEITIATRIDTFNSASAIELTKQYMTPLDTSFDVTFVIDTSPASITSDGLDGSPWSDEGFLVIRGSLYQVRSYAGITQEITTNAVPSGSTFQYTTSNAGDLERGQVLILLASAPYDNIDIIKDQYIDVTDVTDTNNQFGFYYNNGEFFASPSVPQDVYPHIRTT